MKMTESSVGAVTQPVGRRIAIKMSRVRPYRIDAELVVCAPVTKQHNFVPVSRGGLLCGWEGNRGYGLAMAILQTSVL